MTRDPINDPENADLSEAQSCRGCHQLIRPGDEHIYDEWHWHGTCLPAAWLDAAIDAAMAAEQAPPLDTCATCGTTADLWRPFRSPSLYCTTCIPDPTSTRNL